MTLEELKESHRKALNKGLLLASPIVIVILAVILSIILSLTS